MSLINYYKSISLSKKIYFSTALGFFIGMFFGERCGVLEPFNIMFIRIFQITIIPYMVFSILQSIGSLNADNAKLIGKRGGIILLLLWFLSIVYAFSLQLSFPLIERNKFFRPEEALQYSGTQILDLFIPSNPFSSLSQGYIPAIVIFSILVGMALIREERKNKIIEIFDIAASLMKRVNDYITLLLPLGVLVMSSYTFGTLSFMKFKAVLLYIVASIIYLIFMSLVIYPGIMSSVKQMTYRKFMNFALPPALIAFTTGSVFLALPVIYDMMYKFNNDVKGFCPLLEKQKDKGRNMISIIVPLAWVVPASYKFIVIFFVIFSHWYYNLSFSVMEKISTYIGGIPCLFGNNSVTVPFLLNMTGLPNKAYNLFLLTSSFLVYFNNANGAMFIITLTMLCYFSVTETLKIAWGKLIIILAVCSVLFGGVLIALSILMGYFLSGTNEVKEELAHMNIHPYNKAYYSAIKVSYLPLDKYERRESLTPQEPLLDKIVRTQVLQVGYDPEAAPFSFFNWNGQLVGYDIDFVYDIAEELNCREIEFYPIKNSIEYNECLESGIMLDMCVGGYEYRGNPIGDIITSEPYMRYTPAIVIPKEDRAKYHNFMEAFQADDLTIGFRKGSTFMNENRINEFLVSGRLVWLDNYSDFYKGHKSGALMTNAESASVQVILNPGYWVYFYAGQDIKLFFGYLLPYIGDAETFRDMVNAWISVCYRNGFQEARYKYWVQGDADVKYGTAWSILDWLEKNKYFLPRRIKADQNYIKEI